MVKILEFQKGLVDVYNGYACTTSICMNNPEGKKWLVQNYLNYITRYNDSFDYVTSDYFYSDITYNSAINCFQPENIANFPYTCYSVPVSEVCDIIEFIQKKINEGFYLCMFVNLKYLDVYSQNEDLIHDIFIYGYDDDKQLIYSTGYIRGEKYSILTHSYTEIILSYKNLNVNSPDHSYFDTKRISYFKYRENFKYDFNITNFVDTLKDYLNTTTFYKGEKRLLCWNSYRSDENIVYGIEGIKVLICFLKNLAKEKYLDLRQIYFLYNHKINIRYKIEYLIDANYIDDITALDAYQDIVKLSEKCLNVLIKYSFREKNEYIKNAITYLEEIYAKEKDTLSKLVRILENNTE